jgi:phosphatidate phosphatase
MGLALNNTITVAIKLYFGELRPHFIDACNPDFTSINCTDPFGLPFYVTDYTCRGDPSAIREARLILMVSA